MRTLPALLALVALPLGAAGLNDTGLSGCYDGAGVVACTGANAGDAAAYPRQDGRYGRDAARTAGQLRPKVGGGAAGFDFTPLDAAGETIALAGNPPVPAALPACVRDNVTHLIWEIKTAANMYATDTYAGAAAYAAARNGAGLCGYSGGWRIPTRRELLSIIHHGNYSSSVIVLPIDTDYFPNTFGNWYWSSDVYAHQPTSAWLVSFTDGNTYADEGLNGQGARYSFRAVRSGP